MIVTSPSIATGTPFKNFTEYSKISPASEAVTVPDDKSTFGDPASAAPSNVFITTEEESETPFRVIDPVALLSLPRVITVLPFISEAISTFDPSEVKDAGAPVPLKVIVSFVASKLEIITLPSAVLVTAPSDANDTSYI